MQYWLAIYSTILVEEHLIFRKGKWFNYNPDDYNNPEHLPTGLAAALALGFGIMGAVLGMATEWYVGVLGRKSALFSITRLLDICTPDAFSFLSFVCSRRPGIRR